MPANGSLKQRLPTLVNRRITLLIVRLILDDDCVITSFPPVVCAKCESWGRKSEFDIDQEWASDLSAIDGGVLDNRGNDG